MACRVSYQVEWAQAEQYPALFPLAEGADNVGWRRCRSAALQTAGLEGKTQKQIQVFRNSFACGTRVVLRFVCPWHFERPAAPGKQHRRASCAENGFIEFYLPLKIWMIWTSSWPTENTRAISLQLRCVGPHEEVWRRSTSQLGSRGMEREWFLGFYTAAQKASKAILVLGSYGGFYCTPKPSCSPELHSGFSRMQYYSGNLSENGFLHNHFSKPRHGKLFCYPKNSPFSQ